MTYFRLQYLKHLNTNMIYKCILGHYTDKFSYTIRISTELWELWEWEKMLDMMYIQLFVLFPQWFLKLSSLGRENVDG